MPIIIPKLQKRIAKWHVHSSQNILSTPKDLLGVTGVKLIALGKMSRFVQAQQKLSIVGPVRGKLVGLKRTSDTFSNLDSLRCLMVHF